MVLVLIQLCALPKCRVPAIGQSNVQLHPLRQFDISRGRENRTACT